MNRSILSFFILLLCTTVLYAQQIEKADRLAAAEQKADTLSVPVLKTSDPDSLQQSSGREPADSLIRLMSADKASLVEIEGKSFRKIEGNAVFFHNNTHLYCDTALWNVNEEYVDALGSVRIVQKNTVLKGDRIHYMIPENTAQFRGSLVEMYDTSGNVLRSTSLDYNTKDSIAFFHDGASLKDKDGNLFESLCGKYESRRNLFTFHSGVEMYTDSLFVISDTLEYSTANNTAYFLNRARGWRGENFFASGGGWYNTDRETMFLDQMVYLQSKDHEIWSDDLYYDRINVTSEMNENIQIIDDAHGTIVLGDELRYRDRPRKAEILKNPVFILLSVKDDSNQTDSLFLTSDRMIFYTHLKKDLDPSMVAEAQSRKELSMVDPMVNARRNAREAAEAEARRKQQGNQQGRPPVSGKPGEAGRPGQQTSLTDTTRTAPVDSTQHPPLGRPSLPGPADSLSVSDSIPQMDSIPQPEPFRVMKGASDTTEIEFFFAYNHVKAFKSDMQLLCDSLVYWGIDSIARLYKEPVLWNDRKNQLTADSMQIVIENKAFSKGFLLTNSFVISHDRDNFYNQIKAPEMIGYFTDNDLTRFDAMGGVQALLFMEEDSVITTANKKECKLMTASFKDGTVQRTLYLQEPKSDAHPVEQMTEEQMHLRDFKWRGEERPQSRLKLSSRKVRKSIREEVKVTPYFPKFVYSSSYFKEHMDTTVSLAVAQSRKYWTPDGEAKEYDIFSVRGDIDTVGNPSGADSLLNEVPREIRDLKDPVLTQVADSGKVKNETMDSTRIAAAGDGEAVKKEDGKASLEESKTGKTRKELKAEKRAEKKRLKQARKVKKMEAKKAKKQLKKKIKEEKRLKKLQAKKET